MVVRKVASPPTIHRQGPGYYLIRHYLLGGNYERLGAIWRQDHAWHVGWGVRTNESTRTFARYAEAKAWVMAHRWTASGPQFNERGE